MLIVFIIRLFNTAKVFDKVNVKTIQSATINQIDIQTIVLSIKN